VGGAPIIDCHDCVLLGERRRVPSARDFVEFHTLGEEPRDHKILYHVTVLELVLDRVCVVWAGHLEESLEVVCRRQCLALAATCSNCDAPHAGAPLRTLLVPLLAALDTLLGVMDGDVERCLPTASWGRLPAAWGRKKFDGLVVGGIVGGDIAQHLGDVPKNVVRCLEERRLLCVAHAASGSLRPAPWGHNGVPSSHCVHIGAGFACGVQVARPRSLGEPVGELGV
jgi:hypothetical protein